MIPSALPVSILGEITALTINTPDLEISLQYYQQLGFKEVMRDNFPFPWIQVTDESLLIMLRKDPNPYLALTYYSKDAKKVADVVEANGLSFVSKPKVNEMLQRYALESPDGLTVTIITIPYGFRKPSGATMLTMDPADYTRPETYTNKVAGIFGELAQPVKNLEESILFWQKLGFSILTKFESPYPWAILSDGLGVVGLHQSTHFSYPAITYFAADMKEKTGQLKQQGLENFIEQGPGNLVLTTPEQQHIFLFGMGM